MFTSKPSVPKIVTMVLFTLSCIGLLLFLWLSFGGTIPFAAQGYRFQVAFPNAAQLADEADVRISGVSVGKVIAKSLDPQGNRTIATIQMDNQFAPVHEDARAILRTKTILGETYVELSPGTPRSPTIPDGGMLARSNVQSAVQLDQIFDALDPRTRAAFRQWQQELAQAVRGNGQNLNNVFGNLPAFAADSTDLLQVLDVQHTAVVNLVRNAGTVFAALNHNQSALHNLITSGEQTFATTAANNNSIIQTFHVFPTFLNETKQTMARLQTFALNTNPLITELQPVARNLAPTLNSVKILSPDLESLFTNLGPLITASKTGLPAIRDVLNGATPLLAAVGPFLSQLNPVLTAPATTCASLRRSAPRRSRSRPTVTATTVATPTRPRCGWPSRSRSAPAASSRAASRSRRGTATTRARPATARRPRERPRRRCSPRVSRRVGSRRRSGR
jgi:phospholipid/cholesterol/gamma-HCH transport system substrate-binding protein